MGIVKADPDSIVLRGELADEDVGELDTALNMLLDSGVETPCVDLTGVTSMSSRLVGVLVAGWVEMSRRGRWFDFDASDEVWRVLQKAGLAGAFLKRPS